MRMCLRALSVFAATVLTTLNTCRSDQPTDPTPASLQRPTIAQIVERHTNLTPTGFAAASPKLPAYREKLSFDPTTARYFDLARKELQLTDEEVEIFKRRGIVAIDNQRGYTFSTAFYDIYSADLPVLITSDSILHAMHSSYDNLLSELEVTWFSWTLEEVLAEMHLALELKGKENQDAVLAKNYEDVDLYLTIARNLLMGAGATESRSIRTPWKKVDGQPIQPSLAQADQVEALLESVKSLQMPNPNVDKPTEIYGGHRFIDFSQFRPRGHYADSQALKNYFRCMMWLGRADTGWNVLPTDQTAGLHSDDQRELRNAVLFTELLRNTGNAPRVQWMDRLIGYLVGQHDSLNAFRLEKEFRGIGVDKVEQLLDVEKLKLLQDRIQLAEAADQWIRSQIVFSHPGDVHKTPPPATFQAFGQRFAIDSYALSQVVYDAIIYEDRKQRRMMPMGLDVMASLGNSYAVELLEPELKRWNYSANLLAARTFVEQQSPEYWESNLYSLWLDTLRELDHDVTGEKNAPEVMQTRSWQSKQLQTQLASWAQLRHDTVLYTKQSYTAFPSCEYPAGYVEPYPAFYAKVKSFAETAHKLISSTPYASPNGARNMHLRKMHQRHLEFFETMASLVGCLEVMAKKELAAEPFNEEEEQFLGRTINDRGYARFGSASIPKYNGWYSKLLYDSDPDAVDTRWEPTIADVHTDPESQKVLEVGVGNLNLCVVAIDNRGDRTVYVGPTFSYYEFQQPASDRLTDAKWNAMLVQGQQPSRPQWTETFAALAEKRPKYGVVVKMMREGNHASVGIQSFNGRSTSGSSLDIQMDDEGMQTLANRAPDVRVLDFARSQLTNKGMAAMAPMRELKNLDLSSTRIDGSQFAALKKAEWMRVLLLRNTQVNDEAVKWLANFPRLEVLDLSGTRVTSAALTDLAKLTSLRELNLERTPFDDQAVQSLQTKLPKCRIRK